jgi:hypothetical protein
MWMVRVLGEGYLTSHFNRLILNSVPYEPGGDGAKARREVGAAR